MKKMTNSLNGENGPIMPLISWQISLFRKRGANLFMIQLTAIEQ